MRSRNTYVWHLHLRTSGEQQQSKRRSIFDEMCCPGAFRAPPRRLCYYRAIVRAQPYCLRIRIRMVETHGPWSNAFCARLPDSRTQRCNSSTKGCQTFTLFGGPPIIPLLLSRYSLHAFNSFLMPNFLVYLSEWVLGWLNWDDAKIWGDNQNEQNVYTHHQNLQYPYLK